MVKINRPSKLPSGVASFASIAVGTLFVIGLLSSFSSTSSVDVGSGSSRLLSLPAFDYTANTNTMKKWRQNVKHTCETATTASQLKKAVAHTLNGFSLPDKQNVPAQPRGDKAVRKCKNVVMDFGANIGDTSGHVIDVGMIGCKMAEGKDSVASHFNIESKVFEHVKKRNMLTQNIEQLMHMQGDDIGPEDYCYYGIEGNPHFTQRLQKIEDFVMGIRPRPIQHMHFFTESVGAGQDGMTKLYLDTVNTKENFWGSSIYKDHQDVRKSAEGKDVETVAAPVMGYTIGTLMRKTLTGLDEGSTGGSHLILKVDIEGGEYPLLNQAVEEGTLCEFVKAGNTADLFIEFHSQRVTGKHEFAGKTKQMKETLTKCGVTFRNLAAWWH